MKRRLGVRPLYTLSELARLVRVGRPRLLRLLVECDVKIIKSGNRIWIPVSEIQRKVRPLWDSLLLVDSLPGKNKRRDD